MSPPYVQYNSNIRIGNLYGGESNPSYLGINTKQTTTTNGALDPVGTYKSFGEYVDETQWTIGIVQSSGDGSYVCSGDTITLLNAKDGGYLALFNSYSPPPPTGYPVATTTDTSNTVATIYWTIIITTAKSGTDFGLNYDNEIMLVANFNKLAGVLDTNGAGNNRPFQYLVTGSRLANRDGGSGKWKVFTVS